MCPPAGSFFLGQSKSIRLAKVLHLQSTGSTQADRQHPQEYPGSSQPWKGKPTGFVSAHSDSEVWLSSTVLCSLPSLLTELLYLSPLPVTGKCGHKHVANFHHRNTGVFTQQGVKDHTVVWELQFWLSLSPEQPPPASPAFCSTLQYDFAFDAEAKGAYVGQHGPMASALRRLSARNQESSLPHPDNSYMDIFVRLHHGHCRAEKGQFGSVTETLSHMR